MEWIKENFTSIVVVLICILALLTMAWYTSGIEARVYTQCNTLLDECGCLESEPEFVLNITLGDRNGNKINDTYAEGSG